MNLPNSYKSEEFNQNESFIENNIYYVQNIPKKTKNKNDIDIINKKISKNIAINNKKIKISEEDYLNYEKRKNKKDNISQKLFKKFNDWIIKKIENQIPEPLRKKIFPPDFDIFTHNTNLKDIRFFLDVQIENIIIMTKKDKES